MVPSGGQGPTSGNTSVNPHHYKRVSMPEGGASTTLINKSAYNDSNEVTAAELNDKVHENINVHMGERLNNLSKTTNQGQNLTLKEQTTISEEKEDSKSRDVARSGSDQLRLLGLSLENQ
mmetsp:Transcript_20865/g.32207  ORF Transcript_20865/g.32207 Transcript_20865/m.32207 type:complete len:120 (-) Transcript_20865:169-528(-)|eukprot:CAMPEP_0170481818 /NCGR_PEP_ID=MMETSP0208-20121228/2112_1 /TAXON_ID=197538 /ORGANISM="Strombidium inclinatum, Strain S3" /LENGTH=119 /DNA_ID=CAMNT_0010754589 /DNA_START=1688 /DNA_END=2047 /DNA_ORIENTATION=-